MNVRMREAIAIALLPWAVVSSAQGDGLAPLYGASSETKPIVDSRMRFEGVDQDPMANDADAVTWRARLGFETGKAWNTALLAEGDFLWPLKSDYNSTTNGNTAYPVVADPETYEVNRLQLTNTSIPMTTLTLGPPAHRARRSPLRRQRRLAPERTDVRFVARRQQVARQYDVRRRLRHSGESRLRQGLAARTVRRRQRAGERVLSVPGRKADRRSATGWSLTRSLRFRRQSRDSIGDVRPAIRRRETAAALQARLRCVVRDAERVRRQSAYVRSRLLPGRSDGFVQAVQSRRRNGSSRGRRVKGFTTPLATLHKFQGWADKFLTTPTNGVEDRYVNAGVALKGVGPLDTLAALASYHDYEAERIAATTARKSMRRCKRSGNASPASSSTRTTTLTACSRTRRNSGCSWSTSGEKIEEPQRTAKKK